MYVFMFIKLYKGICSVPVVFRESIAMRKVLFSFPAPVSTVLVPSTFELDYKYTLIIVVIMC